MGELRTNLHYLATQILPSIWIVYSLSGLTPLDSVVNYTLGLLAFVAIYEIGYFANDTWDAARDPQGRRRTSLQVDALYIAAFVLARLLCWALIGLMTGWIFQSAWVAGYVCLGIVFALHNGILSGAVRSATFLQLAVLRIVLPTLGSIGTSNLLLAVAVGSFLYAHLRLLSYLDSKGLLAMPERATPWYPLSQAAIFLPLAAFVSIGIGDWLFLELAAYYVAFFGANALLRSHE